jgi:hypothetical protein
MEYSLKNPNRFPKKRLWRTTKRIEVGYTLEPDQNGKYWTVRYRKMSGFRDRWELAQEMAFAKRWRAKERAYQWWCKAKGKPVPKSPYYHQIPERDETQEPDREPIVTTTSCGRPKRKITISMDHLDAQQTSEAVAQGEQFLADNFPGFSAAMKIKRFSGLAIDKPNQKE